MKRYITLFVVLAVLLISCQPDTSYTEQVKDAPATKDQTSTETKKDPIVGYWAGESEWMLFREDGTFVYTQVGSGWTKSYDGTWSLDSTGKLTAGYSGTAFDYTVASASALTYDGTNKVSWTDSKASKGHNLRRIF